MNQTRILRLTDKSKREQYIRDEMGALSHQSLRGILAQYGVRETSSMSKDDMVSAITACLMTWAEKKDMESAWT